MKKITLMLLSVLLIFVFSACGAGTAVSSDENSTVSSGENSPQSNNSKAEQVLGFEVSETITSSEDNSSQNSVDNSESGVDIPYTSVVDGYIEHFSKWESRVVKFNGFQSNEEFVYLPSPALISCESDFAVYVYKKEGNFLVVDSERSEEMGQTFSRDCNISHKAGEYSITDDAIVRFSVRGKMEDIKVFVPKERESEIRLGSAEEFLK